MLTPGYDFPFLSFVFSVLVPIILSFSFSPQWFTSLQDDSSYWLLIQGCPAFHLTNPSLFLPLNTYSILYRCFPRVLKGVSRRNNRIKLPSTADKPTEREEKKTQKNMREKKEIFVCFLVSIFSRKTPVCNECLGNKTRARILSSFPFSF